MQGVLGCCEALVHSDGSRESFVAVCAYVASPVSNAVHDAVQSDIIAALPSLICIDASFSAGWTPYQQNWIKPRGPDFRDGNLLGTPLHLTPVEHCQDSSVSPHCRI